MLSRGTVKAHCRWEEVVAILARLVKGELILLVTWTQSEHETQPTPQTTTHTATTPYRTIPHIKNYIFLLGDDWSKDC